MTSDAVSRDAVPSPGSAGPARQGAIVVAGGESRRMGVAKAGLRRRGVPLVRVAVDACSGPVVVVGPPELATLLEGSGVLLTREDPPGGGPVAGLAAGMAALDAWPDAARDAFPDAVEVVQLLACDIPEAAALVSAVDAASWPGALTWPEGVDAVVPVDDQGWPQFLSGRYRASALRAALARVGDPRGVSVRRLLSPLARHEVHLPASVLADVDDAGAAAAAGLEW